MTACAATKHQIETDSVKPPMPAVQLTGIPAALRDLPQWVLWFWKRVGERWTKVPHHAYMAGNPPRPILERASSTDPTTWMTFGSVATAPAGAGIGFVLTEAAGVVVIDLDDCRNRDTGELTAAAAALVARHDSYTEVSPSGTGVKIYVLGRKPGDRCKSAAAGVEMYSRNRFVAVTGQRLSGTPADIMLRQQEIDDDYIELFPAPPPRPARAATPSGAIPNRPADLADAEILDLAGAAKNSYKFDRLWRGDISGHRDDASSADLALAAMLAFWTQDVAQIERLMRASGLSRRKWDRTDYLPRTIAKALSGGRARYGDGGCDCGDPRRDAERVELPAGLGIHVRTRTEPGGAAEPTTVAASPPQADLSDLAAFRVAPGQPGHPDYWRDETEAEAAAHQADLLRDFNRFPCSNPRGVCLLHSRTHEPHAGMFRCEKWICPGCHAYLVDFHLANCRLRFGQAARSEPPRPLYVSDSNVATWDRDRQRLSRAGASYWCVRSDCDGGLRVISTAPVVGARLLESADAALAIARSLLEIYRGGYPRAVRTSRDWKTPKRDEPSSDFFRVGAIARPDPAFFEEAAQAVGATVVLLSRRGGYGGHTLGLWKFHRQGGWTEEEADELLDYLRIGDIVPKLDIEYEQWEKTDDEDPKAQSTMEYDLALC